MYLQNNEGGVVELHEGQTGGAPHALDRQRDFERNMQQKHDRSWRAEKTNEFGLAQYRDPKHGNRQGLQWTTSGHDDSRGGKERKISTSIPLIWHPRVGAWR